MSKPFTSAYSQWNCFMRQYVCAIYHFDHTFAYPDFGQYPDFGTERYDIPATQVALTPVCARNEREAAAKAYVSTIGRVRVRKLRELNAPQICIDVETKYRVLAKGLKCVENWLGTTHMLHNGVEAWYIRVDSMAPGPLAARAVRCRMLSVLRRNYLGLAMRSPSAN
jgi:hypothetical protein